MTFVTKKLEMTKALDVPRHFFFQLLLSPSHWKRQKCGKLLMINVNRCHLDQALAFLDVDTF